MESVKDLLDILSSQITLYEEMKTILEQETECVVTWDANRTIELVKKKDTLAYKERVLDEAFRASLKRIAKDLELDSVRVQDIPEEYAGELYQEMSEARKRLIALVKEVGRLNESLKILYKTNVSLIEGVFGRLGIAGKHTYGINKGYAKGRTSTISQTG
jgi:flagellar biosynthesis/type III secretory pathway chaperone